jgi:hypothetical protein
MKSIFHTFIFILTLLVSLQAKEFQSIHISKNSDGTQKVRIYMNYLNSYQREATIKGTDAIFNLDLPIPDKWDLLEVSGYIQYTSSILMDKEQSSGNILLNNIYIEQFKLFDHTKTGVKFNIDTLLFQDYNTFTFRAIQHYTEKCEDPSSNRLWTKIDLNKSYIDLLIHPKAVEESIASIKTILFDKKQYQVTPVNYVLTDNSNETLKHYALFTSIAATQLMYKTAEIKVSAKIDPEAHNVIIASKDEVKHILNTLGQNNTHDTIADDIHLIQNPMNPQYAIVIIAPDDKEKIVSCIAALDREDLDFYTRSSMNIEAVALAAPAAPYSAKKFIPFNQKIYFKELGYTTTLLKGQYPPKITLDFKVYPNHYLDSKDKIKMNLHYIFPSVIHADSVLNIYLNDNFSKQIDIKNNADQGEIAMEANKLFDWDSLIDMPTYLMGKGFNQLKFDFSLIPERKNQCEIFNTKNLVATLLDDSYFILPKSKQWIEMPYMQFIANAAYPYSIYPDLQNTALLFTNKENDTIAAGMNFIFYLTQQIGSIPYYLHLSDALDPETKNSHIIAFGSIHDTLMQEMSQHAPLSLQGGKVSKKYPSILKFNMHKNLFDTSRNTQYRTLTTIVEKNTLEDNLILQMFRSDYHKEKTVVMAMAETAENLNNNMVSLVKEKNRGQIKGDLLIYKKDKGGKSFNINPKYILSDLNWLQSISLYISNDPLLYLGITFLILLLITYMLRKYLMKFKEEHHKNVE